MRATAEKHLAGAVALDGLNLPSASRNILAREIARLDALKELVIGFRRK
jgi:hypothetical protein